MVTFGYKDYKNNSIHKSITLDADEFIRRFLQHVLSCRFSEIRYFGILVLCYMKSTKEQCFNLISKVIYFPVLEGLTAMEVWQTISGKDPFRCPKCNHGRMISGLLMTNNPGAG